MSKIFDKGILILSKFTAESPRLTLHELIKINGIPTSTLYRFLQSFLKVGYLIKDPSSQTYLLGPAILRLGRVAEIGMDFRDITISWMDRLWGRTGETIYCSVRLGGLRLCLESRERKGGGIKYSIHPGETSPIYAGAAGKVLLAYLSESELNALLTEVPLVKVAPRTVTNRQKLLLQLADIRNRGYHYTEEEYTPGAWGIAAPLFNSHGIVEASLSIAGVLNQKSKPRIIDILGLLLEATQNISEKLGYVHARANPRSKLNKLHFASYSH